MAESKASKDDLVSAVGSPLRKKSQFLSWCTENEAPLDVDEIEAIFDELRVIFGFQKDSANNMFEYYMTLLDSRASRMSCGMALLSVHGDYIGGENANYKKWFFAACFDHDKGYTDKEEISTKWQQLNRFLGGTSEKLLVSNDQSSMWGMDYSWRLTMSGFSERDYICQVALYLLIWGEANNVRFMPECLCFLYKCALDYYYSGAPKPSVSEYHFLDTVITPIYKYVRDQQFDFVGDAYVRKTSTDHAKIIGYDDINLFFWYPENLENIELHDGSKMYSQPRENRYQFLESINWNKAFYKSYLETRSWIHLIVNFSRIWIIHGSVFWYFFSINTPTLYTKNYIQTLNNPPAPQIQLAVVGLGGVLSSLLSLFAILGEWCFVPMKSLGRQNLAGRLSLLLVLLAFNLGPTIYIFMFKGWEVHSTIGIFVGVFQLLLSLATSTYLSIVAPSNIFLFILPKRTANFFKSSLFVSNFAKASPSSELYSVALWLCVFTAKFIESYFFLTLSLKDPFRLLSIMDTSRCTGDIWFKNIVCKHFAKFCAILLFVTDFILFFLDTYLWYIICNSVFPIILSYSLGAPIFKPWKSKFGKLPEQILTKIFHSGNGLLEDNFAVSKIWNCIVISMFKEHLLSVEQVNKLVYQQETSNSVLPSAFSKAPLFFNYQEDSTSAKFSEFFSPNEEAARRISFFARSLSSHLPAPIPIEGLPSFTVLIPHYSETIILQQKEILKENKASKVSLLDYLKKLHPLDWEAFVGDSKLIDNLVMPSEPLGTANSLIFKELKSPEPGEFPSAWLNENVLLDIPFHCVGFKSSKPELTTRTRIWASLRYQTLYRTISGFNNYNLALRILYYAENYSFESEYQADIADVETELDEFAQRKFKLLVSMQRYQDFNAEEKESALALFSSFPELLVCYLEKELVEGETQYYSVLLDTSSTNVGGEYDKIFRVKLSGNPILGDGKSDNQNHALIFQRGEYIQTIDANQDNYIEECLKIKAVLAEFEELELDCSNDYTPGLRLSNSRPPIAIVGAREFIFSENIGVLGDVAAGKEQTFGTLFARTLAEINGKLHYGHPDFTNAVFMTTRGGISKAQKGLHLNEDIYAGMNAVCRGGLIKHCDYYQCGKGRDLGFGTIVNFTTKIGAGMGEQMLSRELFYMGTNLRIDKFLSFYYAHAGFHINNVFIILSVELFLLVLVCLGSLKHETILCSNKAGQPLTDPEVPTGCYNLQPVLNWVSRFVFSMFICFFISFLPLAVQVSTEKSITRAISRIAAHFISMAPLFEVLVCKVYANSFKNNLHFGGANYVATGRGFATSRVHFSDLYSKYAGISIYSGVRGILATIFATISMWQPSLIWFYITAGALSFAPFLFNPHQFSFFEFFLDYRDFHHWLFRGNVREGQISWVGFKKIQRSKFTGFKKRMLSPETKPYILSSVPPSKLRSLYLDVGSPFLEALIYCVPYLFITSQTGVKSPAVVNPILRLGILCFIPIILNIVFLLILFPFSLVMGNLFRLCCTQFPSYVAGTAYLWGTFTLLLTMELNLALHGWNFTRSLCAFICIIKIQICLRNLTYIFCLTKELNDDLSNHAWWSGYWTINKLGWLVISQPLREILVKTCDLCMFGYDYLMGHALFAVMTPIVMIPFIDKVHTTMLFWLKPSRIVRGQIYSKLQNRKRRIAVAKYFLLYMLVILGLSAIAISPVFSLKYVESLFPYVPNYALPLFQPGHQSNNDTGEFYEAILTAKTEIPLQTGSMKAAT